MYLKKIEKTGIPCGKAAWCVSNTQPYLDIQAEDPYSLGYLEGKYLKNEIRQMRRFIFLVTPFIGNTSYGRAKQDAKTYRPFIPDVHIDELKGIAAGSCMKFSDILLQNVYWDLLFGKYFPENQQSGADVMGCTAIGSMLENKRPVIGQTYDFPKVMNRNGFFSGGFFPTLSFVSHKLPGKPRIFGLRMGAQLGLPTAKNEDQVTVTFNIIQQKLSAKPTMPFCIRARSGLETCQSADAYYLTLYSEKTQPVGHNVLVADGEIMIGVQAHPFDVRPRTGKRLVNTNRYIYEDWNKKYFSRGRYSLNRQTHAENLLKKFSRVTDEDLLLLLGRKYEKGDLPYSGICRDGGLTDAATLAFFTTSSYGLGTPYDGAGRIPF